MRPLITPLVYLHLDLSHWFLISDCNRDTCLIRDNLSIVERSLPGQLCILTREAYLPICGLKEIVKDLRH
jgi:hypothetical protein